MASTPKYLTPSEAAKLLRVDVRTIYSWLRAGKLPGAIKLGGTWRINRDVLSAGSRPAE